MKLRLLVVLLCAFAVISAPLFAQDQPASIPFHHFSLNVPDFDANVKFWKDFGATQQTGGPAMPNGRFTLFLFPNSSVDMSILEDKTAAGGSVGSVIDHIGFQVPDVPSAVAKWKAAGIRVEPGRNDQQAYVYTPDSVKIEILQDATLTVPLKFHHVHFYSTAPLDMQAWYVKMFGGVAGKRGPFDNVTLTNANLTFTKSDTALAATRGRVLSHIGFGVDDIGKAWKDFEAKGVNFDPALQLPGGGALRTAFFIDPWGTEIELIQVAPPAAGGR